MAEGSPAVLEQPRPHLSVPQQFTMLTYFMVPLAITQIVPDLAETAMNRGITSIASDEMVELLASYGLAFYVTRFFAATAMEVRHLSIVLVHTKSDNNKMTVLAIIIGCSLSLCLLIIGLTPAGTWLLQDVHRQSPEVSETTCTIIAYLSPSPLVEALANYYEGGLISAKLTTYAGIARFTDIIMQIVFVVVLLFTPTRTVPILVPVFAMYAGYLARLILDAGFWYVLVRRIIPHRVAQQKPLTMTKGLLFWLPLALVRCVQVISRPLINIVVSRNLAVLVSKEAAAKAIAVLTTVYPTGRVVFSWLNELRAVPPTFRKATEQHQKFPMKTLSIYAAFCTAIVCTMNIILFMIPGVSFYIMHTLIGLTKELAELSVVPLQIFCLIGLFVGPRAHLSGILIMKRKTVFLAPSAIARLICLIIVVIALPLAGLSGAVLGITCLVLGFSVECTLVTCASLLVKFKPDFTFASCVSWVREDKSPPSDDSSPEGLPLTEMQQESARV